MKKLLLPLLALLLLMNCNKTNISNCCNGNPQVTAIDSSVIAVPDIFTPNSDGINDIMYVLTRNISALTFTITKRSGKKVFESTSISTGWDGTVKGKFSKEKEYKFTLTATTVNGKTLSLEGDLCLIRDNCAKGSVSECFFATQFNGTTFDRNIPNLENIKVCK